MIHYHITMEHTEKTIERLAHMQYDLFCRGNLVARSVISIGALIAGALNFNQWWGVILVIYGSYMASSKYASSNHTAHKLVKSIREAGMELPASRYLFRENAMEIITLPENKTLGDPLMYTDICRLGEDGEYFYIFRDQHGGYMIPKSELGEKTDEFRIFAEEKTKQSFRVQLPPVLKILRKLALRKEK